MTIHACLGLCTPIWFRKTGIEKPRPALGPLDGGEPCPLDLVTQNPAGVDVKYANRAPVAAAVLHRIGYAQAIPGCRPFSQRNRSIFSPTIGIYDHLRCTVQTVPSKKSHLLLNPGVTQVEVSAALFDRDGELLIVEQII